VTVLLSAGQLRRAAETALRAGLSTETHGTLDAVAAAETIGLAPIKTWRRLGDYLNIPEALSPACYVTTPGTDGELAKAGPGLVRGDWLVRAFFAVQGRDYEETSDRRDAYLAAARICWYSAFTPGGGFAGLAQGVEWVEDDYSAADISDDDSRWLSVGTITARLLQVKTATSIGALAPVGDPNAPTVATVTPTVAYRSPPLTVPS